MRKTSGGHCLVPPLQEGLCERADKQRRANGKQERITRQGSEAGPPAARRAPKPTREKPERLTGKATIGSARTGSLAIQLEPADKGWYEARALNTRATAEEEDSDETKRRQAYASGIDS